MQLARKRVKSQEKFFLNLEKLKTHNSKNFKDKQNLIYHKEISTEHFVH